jgi:methionine-rich copper-binding protein CopC
MLASKRITLPGFFGVLAVAALAPNLAAAHARLVSAEPSADATVEAPATITLHFNEELETRVSSINVSDAAGHAVAVTPADAHDGKSIAATPDSPLAPGAYTVSWTAVGDDGHAVMGTLAFTVE